jgi:hypothetical protein
VKIALCTKLRTKLIQVIHTPLLVAALSGVARNRGTKM